eukprot:2511256-Rhodomonas_salina.1
MRSSEAALEVEARKKLKKFFGHNGLLPTHSRFRYGQEQAIAGTDLSPAATRCPQGQRCARRHGYRLWQVSVLPGSDILAFYQLKPCLVLTSGSDQTGSSSGWERQRRGRHQPSNQVNIRYLRARAMRCPVLTKRISLMHDQVSALRSRNVDVATTSENSCSSDVFQVPPPSPACPIPTSDITSTRVGLE